MAILQVKQVTVGGLTVVDQSIGVAKTSSGFEGDDGIMGFGPTDLTQGTVAGSPTVPTFMASVSPHLGKLSHQANVSVG